MTRSLNRLAIGLLVLMVALLVQLTRIQVFQRAELNAMPGNQRTLLTEYSRERGPILVDRAPIAESVETEGDLRYLRTYPIGPMFASATGFYSIVYGATGLEKAENEVLSGEDPRLFVDRMQQLFHGRNYEVGLLAKFTLTSRAWPFKFAGSGTKLFMSGRMPLMPNPIKGRDEIDKIVASWRRRRSEWLNEVPLLPRLLG